MTGEPLAVGSEEARALLALMSGGPLAVVSRAEPDRLLVACRVVRRLGSLRPRSVIGFLTAGWTAGLDDRTATRQLAKRLEDCAAQMQGESWLQYLDLPGNRANLIGKQAAHVPVFLDTMRSSSLTRTAGLLVVADASTEVPKLGPGERQLLFACDPPARALEAWTSQAGAGDQPWGDIPFEVLLAGAQP